MAFNSLVFIYGFLPISLVLCLLAPGKLKNTVLLITSLFFFFAASGTALIALLSCLFVSFFCALGIGKYSSQSSCDRHQRIKKGLFLFIGLLFISAVFIFFKFGVSDAFSDAFSLTTLPVPLGVGFFTLQAAAYLADVYSGKTMPEKNIISFFAYSSDFACVGSGPILRYSEVREELHSRRSEINNIADGLFRFIYGLSEKVILADTLNELFVTINSSNPSDSLSFWLLSLSFFFRIYFDFDGYSNMAIGLGRVLGFNFPENFDYPYASPSLSAFWRRWHMTLGRWLRDYIYIPLGGSKKGKWRMIVSIAAVWVATSLWHGAKAVFLLWGAFNAVIIISEKLIPSRFYRRLPPIIPHIITLIFVFFGFIIFSCEDLSEISERLSGMFFSSSVVSQNSLYLLRSYAFVFLISVLFAFPVIKTVRRIYFSAFPSFSRKADTALYVVRPVAALLLLVLCTAFIADGSFNPFIYFGF